MGAVVHPRTLPRSGFVMKRTLDASIVKEDFQLHFLFFFFNKKVVFPTRAEYSYFSANFRLKIFLLLFLNYSFI